MLTFTVHEPPSPGADRIDRADDLEFVRDGFSWLTALFAPLGLAASGLWLAAGAYVLAAGLFYSALRAVGVSDSTLSVILTALNVYLAFEVSSLKRWDLERKGWRMLGVVNGKSLAECERRFLESWLPAQPVIVAPRTLGSEPPPSPPRSWPFGARA